MIIFDSNFVLTLFRQIDIGPEDPTTGKPLEFFEERVMGYFQELDRRKEVIGIPSPVIAELGIRGQETVHELVARLSQSARFQLLSFDSMAAIDCALIAREAKENGNKRFDAADPKTLYSKLKYDRQILAIALANKAHTVCTWDKNLMKLCKRKNINVVSIFDLQVPDDSRQFQMDVDTEQDEV